MLSTSIKKIITLQNVYTSSKEIDGTSTYEISFDADFIRNK